MPEVIPICTAAHKPLITAADVPRRGPCVRDESPPDKGKTGIMIQLTRLNNKALTVNSDLIKFVEQSPDTLITLITGEKIVVRERADEVLARIVEFRRSVLRGLSFGPDASSLRPPVAECGETSEPEPEG
jgi:flagellar protein FlbD